MSCCHRNQNQKQKMKRKKKHGTSSKELTNTLKLCYLFWWMTKHRSAVALCDRTKTGTPNEFCLVLQNPAHFFSLPFFSFPWMHSRTLLTFTECCPIGKIDTEDAFHFTREKPKYNDGWMLKYGSACLGPNEHPKLPGRSNIRRYYYKFCTYS